MNTLSNDTLTIGSHTFASRLIVGSGKYKDFTTTKEATLASGAEIITVAVRRVNIREKIHRFNFCQILLGVSMLKKQSRSFVL